MDAGKDLLDEVLNAYKQSEDLAERVTYIFALGCNENSQFLSDYLTMSLDGSEESQLKSGEWFLIMESVYSKSHVGFNAFTEWLRQNSLAVLDKYVMISNTIAFCFK